LSLPGILVGQALGGVLLALGRIRFWNLLQVLVPTVTLLAMLTFVVGFRWGITGAVAACILAQVLDSAVVLYRTRDLWLPLELREALTPKIWHVLRLGLKLGVINSISLLNYRIELLLLEAYRGLGAVGIYSMATSLAELIWLISTAISTAVIAPAIGSDADHATSIVARGVRLAFVGSTVAAIALGAVAFVFVPIVFGPAFHPAVAPLILLLPGVVAYAPASVVSVYFSMREGRTRHPLATSMISAACTALLCVALIPTYGMKGAAIASTIGYLAGIVYFLGAFAKGATLSRREVVPKLDDFLVVRHLARRLVGRF
jgi:O-antigen/teichoic acid export membrane protein